MRAEKGSKKMPGDVTGSAAANGAQQRDNVQVQNDEFQKTQQLSVEEGDQSKTMQLAAATQQKLTVQ